jgi:hypothetical protein
VPPSAVQGDTAPTNSGVSEAESFGYHYLLGIVFTFLNGHDQNNSSLSNLELIKCEINCGVSPLEKALCKITERVIKRERFHP